MLPNQLYEGLAYYLIVTEQAQYLLALALNQEEKAAMGKDKNHFWMICYN